MGIKFIRSCILALVFSAALVGCGTGSDGSDITYVALGASDATGIGATPLTNGYVFLIRDHLESDGVSTKLENLGIPGAEIGAIRDVELAIATRRNPDLITLFTGANDVVDGKSVQSFQDDLDKVIAELRDKTSALIVIADLPDLTKLPRYIDNPNSNVTTARVTEFNSAIHQVAAKYSVPLAALSGEPVSDQFVSDADGFHPNDKGHQRIADTFYALIGPFFRNPAGR